MSGKPLTPEQLREKLRAFKAQRGAAHHLLALGYFGSYARNEATADSDVDIVFDTDAPNLFRTVRLWEELSEWLGQEVDIVQLRGLPDSRFKVQVAREAVYV
jgi:hypothetical protein